MSQITYNTQRLDHLGIVAGICQQIGLIEQIDKYVGVTERKVSVGEAVQAMILNALGFVGRALYLTPEFFINKPIDILIGAGLTAEDFNDDSLCRALDMLYASGVTEVFACIASHSLNVFGIKHKFVHLDNTSFSLEGEYAIPSEDPKAVRITHGYSRDHRPDLKQVVVSLICSYQSSIPVWFQALDGNRVDKESFPKIIQSYISQMQASDMPYLYSEDSIKSLSQVKWVTRIPGTLNEVKELYKTIAPEQMQESALEGYSYMELGNKYGGVNQRWFVVCSIQTGRNSLPKGTKAEERRSFQVTEAFKSTGVCHPGSCQSRHC
jgi:transposase